MRPALLSASFLALLACRGTPDTDDTANDDSGDTGGDSGDSGDSGETDDTGVPFSCQDGPSDPGSWFGVLEPSQVTDVNTYGDAGLSALLEKAPAKDQTVTFDPPLRITKAVVTLPGYAPEGKFPGTFWFADSKGAMRTFDNLNNTEDIVVPAEITALPAGSVVSFDVTELKNYSGELEVTGLRNFELHSDPAQKVYVRDRTDGTKLEYATDGRFIVHLWGEVSKVRGPCGSPTCYEMTSGDNVYLVRVKKEYLEGDCLELVAPVGTFNDELQFDISDFDWLQTF